MYYGGIKTCDIADGPGVRVSLFVSGCRNHCKGCFSPETWDFCYGKPFDEAAQQEIVDVMNHDYIKGFTLCGGDPFEPENVRDSLEFMKKLRALYPDKSFWVYSGYTYEYLMEQGEDFREFLNCFDVLIDGRFEEDLKDLMLRFCGSSNQRLIELNKTRETGEIVLWDETSEP